MGMGRKPFMDIQPSDAAICDRAVSCTLPGRSKELLTSHLYRYSTGLQIFDDIFLINYDVKFVNTGKSALSHTSGEAPGISVLP